MIEVYIDGASAGNPGPSGAGVFIKGHGKGDKYMFPLGMMSNHEAEYYSLLKGLELCIQNGYKVVSFRTDSQLVEQAIEKRYVKNATFRPLLENALELMNQIDLFFIKWIPSNQNQVADELARQAIKKNKGM